MKKVLAVLDSTEIYGKEKANILVYNLLEKNGHSLKVAYNSMASETLLKEVANFDSLGFPFPRKLRKKVSRISKVLMLIKSNISLARLIKKYSPDIILIPTEVAFSLLFLPLYLSKAKIVFRMGDDPITNRRETTFFWDLYGLFWRKIILQRINTVVCNSQYILTNLIKSGRRSTSDNILIYNFQEEKNTGTQENYNHLLDRKNNPLLIGYIGRIVEEKGVEILIQSVISLINEGFNVQLLVAGSITYDSRYSENLISLVKLSNCESKIIFLGDVNKTEIFYKSIDILCLPSVYNEPSANVVVEAKNYKKATILFNVGGTTELVTSQVDGYICESISVNSLKKGIQYYLNNEKALTHGESAYQSITRLGINFKSFEKKWLTILK